MTIAHLYYQNMNIYGDTGNVVTVTYRLEQRGIAAKVIKVEVGEKMPAEADIIIAGGGQDSGQLLVEKDLQNKAKELRSMAHDGVVMLTICGTYQLFGHRFVIQGKKEVKGIGIFDLETFASEERMIGNVIGESGFGTLVGFENHSGKTYLGQGQEALATVTQGAGNNSETGEEGAISKNVFGTYFHGPILPKNPVFADELINRALNRKYGQHTLITPLDDVYELRAAEIAATRPR